MKCDMPTSMVCFLKHNSNMLKLKNFLNFLRKCCGGTVARLCELWTEARTARVFLQCFVALRVLLRICDDYGHTATWMMRTLTISATLQPLCASIACWSTWTWHCKILQGQCKHPVTWQACDSMHRRHRWKLAFSNSRRTSHLTEILSRSILELETFSQPSPKGGCLTKSAAAAACDSRLWWSKMAWWSICMADMIEIDWIRSKNDATCLKSPND
jgi:hypothetical protein